MKLIPTFCLALVLTASAGSFPLGAQTGYLSHTVAKGQSLYSIASMYHVPVSEIVRLNPGSDTQIRAGQVLKIPQAAAPESGQQQFHTIQPGETLYQLTVRYNITAQAICAANPGLSASNFRAGQVVCIPPAGDTISAVPTTAPAPVQPAPEAPAASPRKDWKTMHKVERKETIFSISQQYGITQEELIAANPELRGGKLKKGTFLFIPYAQDTPQAAAPTQPATAPTNEELFSESRLVRRPIKTIQAALLLPFTAENGVRTEEQTRMIEFYEGFLMAADSLKRQGVSIDLHTFDTKGSTAVVTRILAQSKMKEMDIIFGPTQTASNKELAGFARKYDTRLVIPFAPKVDEVFTNPNVYQVNTPQSYLYSEVYEHFIRKFGKTNVVFISDGTKSQEKTEFIRGMKNELSSQNIAFKQIELTGEVDGTRLIAAMDTLHQNVFIPTSGSNTALIRMLPHLTLVRREHPHFDMHLFGYPEWQTYTHEHLGSFYELDTYFYSSFYTNNLFPEAVQFTRNYRHWYSKDMANTFPRYGMLGFDIGYYFLKGLSQQGSRLEEALDQVQVTPIQTGFKFERVNNWGGFINRKVFFVHFTNHYELIKLDFE